MTDAPVRRKLSAIHAEDPPSPEALQAVARETGFRAPVQAETIKPIAPAPPPPIEAPVAPLATTDGAKPRRQRQTKGRNNVHTIRINDRANEILYAEANARNVSLPDVIEEALELLARHRAQSAG